MSAIDNQIDELFSQAEKNRFHDTAYITVDELKHQIKTLFSEYQQTLGLGFNERAKLEFLSNECQMLDRKYAYVCEVSDSQMEKIRNLESRLSHLSAVNEKLVEALKKICSTNGLQYSDIFSICDKVLKLSDEMGEGK